MRLMQKSDVWFPLYIHYSKYGEGGVVQPVERMTPGDEILGSIPAVAARSLLVGSVSV